MSGTTMIVLIVLITAIAGVMRAKHGVIRTGRGREEMFIARRDDAETDRLRDEVRGLKERIAVLERIVTDGDRNRGLALEREIDALRDREVRQ